MTSNRKLGAHHIAYLRALAEGVDPLKCARTYLDANEPIEAKAAHREVMETARAIARRMAAGDSAWRLLGLIIRPKAIPKQVTLDAFILERGLEDFPIDEAKDHYFEAYPEQALHQRTPARRARLYERQMALIRTIEAKATSAPSKTDPVEGWFDPATAERLVASGLPTLGDLVNRVYQSPTWYAKTQAIGVTKALRIEAQAKRLLPKPEMLRFDIPPGKDQTLIDAWLESGLAPSTAKNYRREALRFRIWLRLEKSDLPLDLVTADVCEDYRRFLHAIPAAWMSPTASRVAPFSPGWAPFRESLAAHSIGVCVSALSSLYAWLEHSGRIQRNPWIQSESVPTRCGSAHLDGAQLISFLQSRPLTIESASVLGITALQGVPGVTVKSLIEATLSDWLPHTDGSAIFKTSRRDIDINPDVAMKMSPYLAIRGAAAASEPLFTHPRFHTRGLTFRGLNQLLNEWQEIARNEIQAPPS